jgi:hypothetical protein
MTVTSTTQDRKHNHCDEDQRSNETKLLQRDQTKDRQETFSLTVVLHNCFVNSGENDYRSMPLVDNDTNVAALWSPDCNLPSPFWKLIVAKTDVSDFCQLRPIEQL